MNNDELIDYLHDINAQKRHNERVYQIRRKAWWLAVPAAAAVALLVILPMRSNAKPQRTTGLHVYCNNNCQKDDALALIGQNIEEIQLDITK